MREKLRHGGVIRIADGLLREMLTGVLTIDATDTQGMLRDKGVFAEVQKRLLLPETYIVHNIFYEWLPGQWNIVVEGADLPLAIEGFDLSRITPIYQHNADVSTQLVRIDTLLSEDAARKRIDDLRAEINRLETWLIDKENA